MPETLAFIRLGPLEIFRLFCRDINLENFGWSANNAKASLAIPFGKIQRNHCQAWCLPILLLFIVDNKKILIIDINTKWNIYLNFVLISFHYQLPFAFTTRCFSINTINWNTHQASLFLLRKRSYATDRTLGKIR